MRGPLIALAWLALLSVVPASASGQHAAPGSTSFISYDEFTNLSDQAQRPRFAGLTAENQSHLVRTHAERWLHVHRGELSASQIQIVEETIAFLTPEVYAKPQATALVAQEASLTQRLACTLGRDKAREAFKLMRVDAAPAPESGVIDRVIDHVMAVMAWFSDCVMPVEQ